MLARLLLFAFIALCFRLNAQEQEGARVGELDKGLALGRAEKHTKLRHWSFRLAYFNDMQNGGFYLNTDDLWSFGMAFDQQYNNISLNVFYQPLTDRYFTFTRLDQLSIAFSYTWGNLLSPSFYQGPFASQARPQYQEKGAYLGLETGLGLNLFGNILGENVQNLMHDLAGVPQLGLSYQSEAQSVNTFASLDFHYKYPIQGLRKVEDLRLQFGALAGIELLWGYAQRFSLGLGLAVQSGSNSVSLQLSRRWMFYDAKNPNQGGVSGLWKDTYNSFMLGIQSKFGFFQRNLELSLGKDFGVGSFEFVWTSLSQKKAFVEANLGSSFLYGIGRAMTVDRFTVPLRIAGVLPLSVSLMNIRDITGDPRLFAGNSLARRMESFYMLMGGIQPRLDLKKFGKLELFASVGLGVYNIQAFSSLSDPRGRERRQVLSLGSELGLRWYGLELREDASQYGLELSLIYLNPIYLNGVPDRLSSTLILNSSRPLLALFAGICIMVDL